MQKKAVAPIIATVLLIAVAIALFLIIFFWLKGFQKEVIMKQGTAIENLCPRIKFEVTKTGNSISIRNEGEVPIQKFKLVDGTSHEVGGQEPLMPGDVFTTQVDCTGKLRIIPFLRGQTNKGFKDYACEAQIKTITC
ncbi:MAG: archaellin/type IV pilin N-terminal domain-containing protein [Candidatus Pacearchaeota archaeon]